MEAGMLKKISWMLFTGISLLFAAPSEVLLKGTVKKADGTAISGAKVYLASDTTTKVSSDADGKFALEIVKTLKPYGIDVQRSFEVTGQGASLGFSVNAAVSKGLITLFSGNGRIVKNIPLQNLSAGTHNIPLVGISNGFYILQITLGDQTVRRRVITAGSEVFVSDYEARKGEMRSGGKLAKVTADVVDTLIATKEGFVTKKTAIDAYVKEGIEIVMEEEGAFDCVLPDLPATSALKENQKLPDPFTFFDGTKVTKKSQWPCRRKEILAMASKYLYGEMPPKPDEVTGTVSGGTITVNCKQGSKTANFSINASGSGDILSICFGGFGCASISGARSATVNQGNMLTTIKQLYGSADIGEMIAAAWAIERIIDVLELNPDKGIDPKKVVISGCSTNGKATLAAGAYCDRVALTIIIESGALGGSSLRMTEWFRHGGGNYNCNDGKPQGIDNVNDGNWLGSVANWIRSSPSKVKNLPFDQHMVLACIAPRPCLYLTNANVNAWCHLGATCEALSAWAAEPVWNALGVPENFGFNMAKGAYSHCDISKNSEHPNLIKEFYKRVFEGNASAKTDVMGIKEDELYQPKSQWKDMWVDWDMETKLE
jgi:hypothetical protein